MRRTRFLVATAAAAALLIGVATTGAASSGQSSGAVFTSGGDDDDDRDGPRPMFGALLTGSAEVPEPGDDDGAAAAVARINPRTGRVCVIAFATNQIEEPIAFHIHRGTAVQAGPIVVDFTDLLPAGVGCVSAGRPLARAIIADPAGYYFNVHTPSFPAGAVRGTLVGFG